MPRSAHLERRELAERVRGFVYHAVTHLERGNRGAVLEALEDIRRIVDTFATPAVGDDDEGGLA